VVWGDHGWHLGDQTIWGKHSTFERALRSPLLVRVPGMRHAGAATEAIVEAVDLYPTLAELAGLPRPGGLDGRSLVPILEDPSLPGKEGAYSRWTGRRTLRTERYRIVLHETGEPRVELFDHERDPYETKNVAAENPEVVKRLMAMLGKRP
jgi:arylsulfatase A-like enzyme